MRDRPAEEDTHCIASRGSLFVPAHSTSEILLVCGPEEDFCSNTTQHFQCRCMTAAIEADQPTSFMTQLRCP